MSKKREAYVQIVKYASPPGYRFRVRGANGKIICHSEHYRSKRALRNAIRIVTSPLALPIVWP